MTRGFRTLALILVLAGTALAAPSTQAELRAELAADVNRGPSGSMPGKLTTVGDAVYFRAYGSDRVPQMWRADGKRTRAIRPAGVKPEDFQVLAKAAYREQLYFTARTADQGLELWRTTGSGEKVELVPGFIPGRKSIAPGRLAVARGLLFFRGGSRLNRELWICDGRRVRLVKEIKPGDKGSSPGYLTGLGDRIVFQADDGIHGGELWVSDGTAAGTRMIHEITPGPEGTNMAWFSRVGDSVYFTAISPEVGLEPWRTDGDSAQLVADVEPGDAWSSIQEFVTADGYVYFADGKNLWKSDDAWPEATIGIVPDDDPALNGFNKGSLAAVNGKVFFSSVSWDPFGPYQSAARWTDGNEIRNLSDPEAAGFPGFQPYPKLYTGFGGRTLFVANDVPHGIELRVVQGNTYRLFDDLLEGESGSRPRDLTRSKRYLYFTADDGLHGREVWRLRVTGGASG